MNVSSVAFNGLLLYLIAYHSNFGTPIYQVLLAIDASLDLLFAIIVLLGQPRHFWVTITGGGYLIYISNGFFAGWSHDVDIFLIFAWLWVLHLNIMWIPIQFVYRYTFICLRENASKARLINCITALVSLLWAGVGFVVNYVYSRPYASFQAQGSHVLALNFWEVANDTITVGSNLMEAKLQCFLGMWFTTCGCAIVIVVVVEVHIKRFFGAHAPHQSTKKLHKDFHRALLAMAMTPLVTTTTPVMYYISACLMELSPGPIQVFVAVACTSITMFNPLTTVLFMRCYREVVFKPCMRKKVRVDAGTTQATGLSVAPSIATLTPTGT
ncbi:hypothetical protein AAVH_21077 [Aphelenchoides avenae]|nr:hypothetical protein AAVH_21077 [Aphelenchus avenae]